MRACVMAFRVPVAAWRILSAFVATMTLSGVGSAQILPAPDGAFFGFAAPTRDRAPAYQPPATAADDGADERALRPELRRQIVPYRTAEAPGTIVIDTPHTFLYYVLGGGRAIRYGIGVGREGFTWSGVRTIERKAEWPDWYPPAEMIARQPYLPRMMAGGPGNPLGARAMYLSGTMYRIHGTNAPETIGKHVSSGCIRMLNADAIDLYDRAPVGTKVVVLPAGHRLPPVADTGGPVATRAAPDPLTVRAAIY
jgi:lipoprotein-anchoring transpeptidase ErfK/SrfK